MSSAIQPLPDEVIKLIAAGEVIDSLAAVVRELVENAIDAKATRITISLWTDNWCVQVADNGQGMSLDDLKECLQPHSTSKISTQADLWQIKSLGFRGEALHSLGQLSRVEILSRTIDSEGWRVCYHPQGKIERVEPIAIAIGSIITISDLFGNIPLRRKGLPSRKQQLKEIQHLIQDIAICHPQITWQVCKDDQLWFSISPSDNSQQLLPQLIKQLQPSDLHYLKLEVNRADLPIPSKLELLIGLPDRCHRHKPDWVKVAINGRRVKCAQIEHSILSAFSKTLPRDRYPVCFLHLNICPSQIDWNRHPAKQAVYLHSVQFWQKEVTEAIEKALRLSHPNLPANLDNQRVSTLLKVAEDSGNYNLNRKVTPETPVSDDLSLIELNAIAQIHQTYIAAEHPTGLWLIEQHIAHERVLYEQLVDSWQLEPLESPIILSGLTPHQFDQLERLGFQLEPFGEKIWAVRNLPKLLKEREDKIDAVLELSLGGNLEEAQVATACRSAIRNGRSLTLPEMQTLLDQWKNTRNPRTCPHGRPIYLSLEESSLSRFFKRHWVIGKSHGI